MNTSEWYLGMDVVTARGKRAFVAGLPWRGLVYIIYYGSRQGAYVKVAGVKPA